MMCKISIAVDDNRWSQKPELIEIARKVLKSLASYYHVQHKSVSVLLTHKDEMQALNQQWRGKMSSTNVLAFSAAGGLEGRTLGDIAVSYDHVCDVSAHGKSEKDYFAHMLVHAFLHLMGYDHENDAQASVMEGEETQRLVDLGFAHPYEDVPPGG